MRPGLWAAAGILAAVAAALRPAAVPPAAAATLGPFATLTAIIVGSALADRAGAFGLLARVLIPGRASRPAAAAAVLAFTALLSALANLDVAVVVALPVALRAARRHRLPAERLAVAVAVTANATSFLLPTSNITGLLLLGRQPLPAPGYLSRSWLPWLLVAVVTIGALCLWLACGAPPASPFPVHWHRLPPSLVPRRHRLSSPQAAPRPAGSSCTWLPRARPGRAPGVTQAPARAVTDLAPLFLAASAIRAILAGGIALHGGLARQLAASTALTCAVSNLPAAAALRPAGTAGLWAAVLATTIGANLVITGSVATLICRRIARDAGVALRPWLFTAVGAALAPAQLAVAIAGLLGTGALR